MKFFLNHRSMNWAQFKDPVSHMCLAGAVVASWFITQETAGSDSFTVMTSIFVTEVPEFSENIWEKLQWIKISSRIKFLQNTYKLVNELFMKCSPQESLFM